ncbi:MAG: hypothetical protein ACOCUV_01370 [bacterium]
MKKIKFELLISFLLIFHLGLAQGNEGKKENRINISVGAFSPQLSAISNTLESLNSQETEIYSLVPNINFVFETRRKGSLFGYGGNISYATNLVHEEYVGAVYYTVEHVNPSWEDFSATYSYSHSLLGGSLYLYPDKWIDNYIKWNRLDLFVRTSLGIEFLNVGHGINWEDKIIRNEVIPYLSIYGGIRIELFNWLALQTEAGYRELAAMKFGLTFKW